MTVSAAFVPIDAAARERAVRDLDTCLVVEAGAGTGKTTLMVARILEIIRTGRARVDQVVAITFTERAAAELRVRVRAKLEQTVREAADEERERLRDALDRFDQARIETIHAFAGALLRERPVEARLDPAFAVLSEPLERQAFEDAYETWLDDQLAGSPAAARRALNVGLALDKLRDAARLLHDERDLLPERWPAPAPEPRETLLAWLREQVDQLLRLRASCRTSADLGYQAIERLAAWTDRAERATPEAFERVLAQRERVKSAGNQANWRPKEDCVQQKEVCAAIDERLQQARSALGHAVTAELAGWLTGFVRGYERERRRRARAEFQDLLIWACDLLRDSLPARRYFQQRFTHILVDEFQDTDPLQVEIVFYLAGDGSPAARWQDVRLVPGKLFIVGDPKQAIYRFRRADLTVYNAARQAVLDSGGDELEIAQNFRSVEPVITWVNAAFTRLLDGADPAYQAVYRPLVPRHPGHPDFERSSVVVADLPPEDEAARSTAESKRRDEGRVIARLVRRLVQEEAWPVLLEADGRYTTRRAKFGDVALLFGATTDLELYEDALRAEGVPYRIEGGRLFYHRQEVRDLTNALAAVDDPTDRLALVAALKSTAFAFADEELFLYHDAGGRFDYLAEPGEAWPRFREAFALLRRLHDLRLREPAAVVTEALLQETRMVELALLQYGGDQIAANLFKVVEQARSFDERPRLSFRAFVRWLADNQRRPPREADSGAGDGTGEMVHLLTMHAAKGLEFPVVLLANPRGAGRPEICIADRATGTVEFRLGDHGSIFRTGGYDDAASREALHQEAENLRLLYVACTRARDHLVIPLTQTSAAFTALVSADLVQAERGERGLVHQYDADRLAHTVESDIVFRLEVGDGPEADAVLAARTEWWRRRRELLQSNESDLSDDGNAGGEQNAGCCTLG